MKKFLLVSNLKHSTSALHFFPRPCPRGSQLGPVPGWPVICGVVLAIIQGAILIQGAGNDQAEFVPYEEAKGAVRRLEHNQSSNTQTQNSGWWQRATLAGGAKQALSLLPVLQQDCGEHVKGHTGSCVSLFPTSQRKSESQRHHCLRYSLIFLQRAWLDPGQVHEPPAAAASSLLCFIEGNIIFSKHLVYLAAEVNFRMSLLKPGYHQLKQLLQTVSVGKGTEVSPNTHRKDEPETQLSLSRL